MVSYPKTLFCGSRKVTIGVCETICVANTGAACKAMMVQKMGISPGKNMYKALRDEDKGRVYAAARKTSNKYRRQRKKLKFGIDREKVTKKVSYRAGCFGTSIEPETVRSNLEKNFRGRAKGVQSEAISGNKRQKRKNSMQNICEDSSAPKISFIDEGTLGILKIERENFRKI